MKKVIPILSVPVVPTEEAIDFSVNKNMSKLQESIGQLSHLLFDETPEVPKMYASPNVKFTRLLSIIEEVDKIISPHTACGKGCSHCCNMAVGITQWEADRIGKHLGITPESIPEITLSTVDDYHKQVKQSVKDYLNVPCPFLDSNECSVYEVRPIACRTCYNMSDYPILCDTLNHNGLDVPNLNMMTIWTACADVGVQGGHGVFGDIREFFTMEKYNAARDI